MMNEVVEKSPKDRGFRCLDDSMSNFDHVIPDGLEDALKQPDTYCDYAAWNFHAQVWHEDSKFHAFVQRFHSHVATVSAETLQDLQTDCSNEWGHD